MAWHETENCNEIAGNITMKKALIVSVGGTAEPLVKSIQHHAPEFVCFSASQETVTTTARVREALGEIARQISFEIELVDNENDLLECHATAAKAVQRVQRRGFGKDDVIIDYTGGTKNMSVALALAAIEEGYSFSYIGGDRRTKDGVGIVENGHEHVYANVNPWDHWAIRERRQAADFFNACQFKPCREIVSALAGRTTKNRSMYKKLAFVVDGYYHWDLFRHGDAMELFKKARIVELTEADEKGVVAFADETMKLLPLLEQIITGSDHGKRPCSELALDLFANAERRFAEGKTDDAILRLYRLVEMLAQQKLLEAHGINVSDVKPEQVPDILRTEFVGQYKNSRTGKIEISQSAAYQLLKDLGDALGESFVIHANRFRDIQSARNYSYLAHGFQSSKDATYTKLRDFVADLGVLAPERMPVFPRLGL